MSVLRRRIVRRLTAVALLALVGCQGEVEPDAISASVVQAGRYAREQAAPVLVESTTKIPCDLGTYFGVDYRIDVAGGQFGIVPVEFHWVHPELSVPSRKLWGTETAAGASNPRLEWRAGSLQGRALWSLEVPEERVSGRYEFQIRIRDGGRVLLSHAFDLEGC